MITYTNITTRINTKNQTQLKRKNRNKFKNLHEEPENRRKQEIKRAKTQNTNRETEKRSYIYTRAPRIYQWIKGGAVDETEEIEYFKEEVDGEKNGGCINFFNSATWERIRYAKLRVFD